MAASLIFAFQSVIMLIVISYTSSITEAGVFTIAYANANLMHIIGKWGMRNFQVSDVKGVYPFKAYLDSRIITSVLMILVSFGLILFLDIKNGYSLEKTMIIGVMCIFKLLDVVEDVYTGLYQKCGRLDIGAKCMALRLIATVIIFVALSCITKNLLISLIISTVISTLMLIYFLAITYPNFNDKSENAAKRVGGIKTSFSLLIATAPLSIGIFLQFYIGNAPKYAIDSMMDDSAQACFGFISMPVFVIGLFASFIFTPIVHSMSVIWNNGEKRKFTMQILRQLLYIFLITIACVAIGYAIGLPVLSFLYNTDLSAYMFEFIALLIAGGFLAATSLFVIALTIIRLQKAVLGGYLIAAACAFIFSGPIVAEFAMKGASILYFAMMVGISLIFAGSLVYGIFRKSVIESSYD
jgi:O-antigen/teichoic acid export membrane protein